MNDLYFKYYKKYPINECADAGYGIYKNYQYMNEHNINNYVKFQTWEGEANGKRPQLFYTFSDGVLCLNTCNYSYICKKNLKNKDLDFRQIELMPEYELFKEQARVNLLSSKGIEIRVNRSIQVEGTFGQLKQNMQYIRIRRRGLEKVKCEIMLMCLGKNIRKFLTLLDKSEIKSIYWRNNNSKAEKFPFPKQKIKKN